MARFAREEPAGLPPLPIEETEETVQAVLDREAAQHAQQLQQQQFAFTAALLYWQSQQR